MSLNEQLRAARTRARLTQEDVESHTGINKKTISNWENGVSRPDVDNIVILCKLYGVTPNDLFEWERYDIETLAAHHDNDDWSDEECAELEEFKKYILSKRKK